MQRLTEPAPRRRRAWPVIVPFLVVALAAAAWSAFWFYAADRAEQTIAGWLEREAGLGRVYRCGSRGVAGFPFRIEVRCREAGAELRNLQPPLSLSLPGVLVAAQIYQPTLLISEFDGPLTISEPGQPETTADWKLARTSVRGNPRAPERVSVVLDGATIERGPAGARERLFQAAHAEFHARMVSGSLNAQPVLDFAANLIAATAPGLHPLARQPTDIDLDSNLRGLRNLAPKPWPERFREIQAASGRIEVRNLRVKRDEWLLVGAGSLGLTPNGNLDGELRVTIAGLDKLFQSLGVDYLARPGNNADRLNSALNALDRLMPGLGQVARQHAGTGMAAGVALLGEPAQLEDRPAVSLPLRVVDGAVYLGPVPVGRAPKLF